MANDKVFRSRSKATVKVLLYCRKGIVIMNTHAKYESPISKDKKVMTNLKIFQKWVKGHVTFNLLTPKCIGVFLSLSSICVWGMNFVGWGIFELSHYNKV